MQKCFTVANYKPVLNSRHVVHSLINGTCQDEASKYFSQLPTEIRKGKNLTPFCSALRSHLFAPINQQ